MELSVHPYALAALSAVLMREETGLATKLPLLRKEPQLCDPLAANLQTKLFRSTAFPQFSILLLLHLSCIIQGLFGK
jgi:hypothetical protein